MSKIRSIIKYICLKYPHSSELSNARLTKMVYLADWFYAQKYRRQMTDITWYFNNYGPFVDDVIDEAVRDPEIEVINTSTIYGTPKVQIQYVGNGVVHGLERDEEETIDQVIRETSSMYWDNFIRYVYNTDPIRENPRYSNLNLVDLANNT